MAGVCGGIGNYFRIDPVFIRLIIIFLTLLTVFLPLIIAYFIASLIIPLEPANSPAVDFKRLYRSKGDRIVAGICGGLSKLFKMDTTILRLIIIVLTLVTGIAPLLVAYLIGWLIIPEKNM